MHKQLLPVEILMSKKAKEVSEISLVHLRAGWKELTAVIKLSELLSGRGVSADAVVNVTAVEVLGRGIV